MTSDPVREAASEIRRALALVPDDRFPGDVHDRCKVRYRSQMSEAEFERAYDAAMTEERAARRAEMLR